MISETSVLTIVMVIIFIIGYLFGRMHGEGVGYKRHAKASKNTYTQLVEALVKK